MNVWATGRDSMKGNRKQKKDNGNRTEVERKPSIQTGSDASAGAVAGAGLFATCFGWIALLFARSLPLAR